MSNISGFGLRVNIVADITFPVGFIVTAFADDSDPLDVPSLQVGDSAMGLNGDLITWSKANPIKVTLNVLPNTDSNTNLAILLEANRPGKGKVGTQDVITMSIIYPEGNFITLTNGAITDGIPFSSVSSASRIKTFNYSFAFENRVGA